MWANEDDACKVADELIAKDRMEYPWITEKKDEGYGDMLSKASPKKASKFYYVHYAGMTQSNKLSLNCELSMEGDANKAPLQQRALAFAESCSLSMLGDEPGPGKAESAEVPPEWELLKTATTSLKTTYL